MLCNLSPNSRSFHDHRRAYSASTFVHLSFYSQQPSGTFTSSNQYQFGSSNRIWTPTATHPVIVDNGGGAVYRERARAHTTSGYLPTVTLASPPSPTKSSSFMDRTPGIKALPLEEHSSLQQQQQQQQQQQRHRYHCPHCRKTFSRPSSLRIHIYSHTGEKSHVCPYFDCQRRVSVQSNMRRHICIHTGNNNTTLSRGENPSHLNDDHLDVSPAGPIYQKGLNPPSFYPTSNFMLHGH